MTARLYTPSERTLIGVVRDEDGIARQILRSAGLNVAALRQKLREAATR
jgi:Clp amino terminal domain, pathogenicity island component